MGVREQGGIEGQAARAERDRDVVVEPRGHLETGVRLQPRRGEPSGVRTGAVEADHRGEARLRLREDAQQLGNVVQMVLDDHQGAPRESCRSNPAHTRNYTESP